MYSGKGKNQIKTVLFVIKHMRQANITCVVISVAYGTKAWLTGVNE